MLKARVRMDTVFVNSSSLQVGFNPSAQKRVDKVHALLRQYGYAQTKVVAWVEAANRFVQELIRTCVQKFRSATNQPSVRP
jgi:hypothetical protein